MKKTMQFLFAMSIMMEGFSSFAGTNKALESKTSINPPLASPVKRPMVVIVTVVDDDFEPVSRAKVSAPCTGQRPIETDWTGTAIFHITAQCHCENARGTVTTEKGDVENVELHEGTDNVVFVR